LWKQIEIKTPNFIPMQANICMVTLDGATNKNLIVWEKYGISAARKYCIYKQSTITSLFEKIHEQPFDSLSVFLDTASKPSQEISRYKITAVDSCGYETDLSSQHTTLLLSSNLGTNNTVNLSWNAYEGFTFPNYEIWRSPDEGVNYFLLSTVANNTYSYIDNAPPSKAYYQIRITNSNSCEPSRLFNQVKSNIVDKQGLGIGLNKVSNNSFSVFPNPTESFVNIKTNELIEETPYEITSLDGSSIKKGVLFNGINCIKIENHDAGVYFLKVKGSLNEVYKIVKQ
jgi:hypothetical protein